MQTDKIKKILIVRLGAIGDVVHSSALFKSIKKACPNVKIHYATTKAPSLLIENDRDLNKLWILNNNFKSYKYLFNFAKELRKEKYDLCINLQPSIRIKFFCLMTGAKRHLVYKKLFKYHAVENFWRTALPIFKDIKLPENLEIFLPQEKTEEAKKLVKDINKPLVCLNIGTSPTRQGRRWPIKNWQNLATELISKYQCQIILTGAKEDLKATQQLEHLPFVTNFCAKSDIATSAALMSLCKVVISGDTGPLHIATALNIPTIGLYGAAPISRTGPYGTKAFTAKGERACIPCNRRKCKYLTKNEEYTQCMLEIKPEKLLNIIDKNNLIDT
ncbi:MAG: glycosyltransferase family 9 protein [Candidatus Gastranaerophilales bacterium]|nr:glycosyltransferase family 9 protein [Candidatus Gastranaerophilales bacterium]